MLLLPPEKPAKKWGSINPVLIRKSASTTLLFTSTGVPREVTPIFTVWLTSWLITWYFPTIFLPSFLINASWLKAGCNPRAIIMVMFSRGIFCSSSANIGGNSLSSGQALVLSVTMTTTLSLLCKHSIRGGLPKGKRRLFTIASASFSIPLA